jgi:DegV family protein with EDD domain
MKKRGVPITTLESWALENRLKIVHLFTVGDLMYLHRGGRLSKTSAVAGSILGIKPVLHVDDDGRLQLLKKVRGRKQSLTAMVDLMEEKIKGWENEEIVIAHGDCLDDAKFLAHEIKKRLGIQNVIFSYIGMVIGCHSGPGTIMLGFMGEPR